MAAKPTYDELLKEIAQLKKLLKEKQKLDKAPKQAYKVTQLSFERQNAKLREHSRERDTIKKTETKS